MWLSYGLDDPHNVQAESGVHPASCSVGTGIRIPAEARDFPPKQLDRLWGPPTFLFSAPGSISLD